MVIKDYYLNSSTQTEFNSMIVSLVQGMMVQSKSRTTLLIMDRAINLPTVIELGLRKVYSSVIYKTGEKF